MENGALPHGGKVHRLNQGRARCGVGRRDGPGRWQLDLTEVTCRRCQKLLVKGVNGK